MANPWEMDWTQGAPAAPAPRQPTIPEMVVAPQPDLPPAQTPNQAYGDQLANRRDELQIADLERKAALAAAAGQGDPRAEAVAKLGKVIDQIDYLYRDSSDNAGWFETGYLGSKLRDTGGTAAYDLGQQVQTVEANAAFDALQRMREASPTGGALGQITERELDLLKSSVANINPNQSQEEFIRSLGVAKGIYLDALRRIDPAAADEILNRAASQTDPAGNVTYDQRGRDALALPVGPDGTPPPPDGGGGGFVDGLTRMSEQAGQAFLGVPQGLGAAVDFATMLGTAAMPPSGSDMMRVAQGESPLGVQFGRGTDLAGAFERAAPTPPGMEGPRFAGQLAGGLIAPGPKAIPRVRAPATAAAPNAAREVIEAGARNNVRVMTSDVRPPTTFTGKSARAIGERIPYAGTGGQRAAQQNERIEAVRELARETGADVATELIDEVADDFAKTRGSQVTALTRRKNAVIDSIPTPLAPANVVRTLEAIDAQTRRLASIDAEAFAPVIDRLTRFGVNIASGKTLREIEGNRKLLGDMFEDASLAAIKGDGQKALNAIYAPLRDDMAAFIQANAGTKARTTWANANKHLSALMGELDDKVFAGVLRSSDTTPENVARILFSTKPSEVRRLVSNLSPEGRSKAQAAIIERAIQSAGGLDNISPDRFANEIGRLGKSVGVVFEGADLARVQGLEKLLQATKQASVAAAAPPTGVQNAQLLMAGGVGASGGTGAIPLAIYGGLARLYESAPMRNMLVGLGRSQPGSKAEGRMLERILKVVTSQTQIRGPAANDVLAQSPARLAAQDQELN